MATTNRYNNNSVALNDLSMHSIWQPEEIFDKFSVIDISDEVKAQLESERLNEWRKNIAKIRAKH